MYLYKCNLLVIIQIFIILVLPFWGGSMVKTLRSKHINLSSQCDYTRPLTVYIL